MTAHQKLKDSTGKRLVIALIAGAIIGLISAYAGLHAAILLGWDTAVLVFVIWVWIIIWPMDADSTARYALREDPSRGVSDIILILASIASLGAVGLTLVESHQLGGLGQIVLAGVGLLSVVVSWVLVHTLFTLLYAKLYYSTDGVGGIDFKHDHHPSYSDFAYLAFTVGMTFQIADTDIIGTKFRKTVLRHAILSYLFGTVIVATTINLIAGLNLGR